MTRTSSDQFDPITDYLVNGYDYVNQAWVLNGVYQDCGHPKEGESYVDHSAGLSTWKGCNCYGRLHAGGACTVTAAEIHGGGDA